jgi:serine/threonine protein kinase
VSIPRGSRLGHYVIEDLIAQGGMGSVWRARDTRRNQLVAIKAVADDLIADPEFRIRIQDEARRHQRLQHPNIVPVPDVFASEGVICIVMKLIEGSSLAKVLESRPGNRLGVDEAIRIIGDVLRALDYAHRNGIVHRDVKPSNILVDHSGWVWLFDFGISIAMGEQRRTRAGVTVGTLSYMSPEQITHPRAIDHRSDVYSVGCLFYELLTGRPPFVRNEDGVGNTDFALQEAHVKKQPVNPRGRVPNIPPDLDKIIMQALAKDPDERIPGCQEFVRLLDQVGKAVNGGAGRAVDQPSRGKQVGFVVLVVVAVALLLLIWYFRPWAL